MRRPFAFAALAVLFCAAYVRGVDWLGLDDVFFLRDNPHLGHGLASYWWAITDVEFGRRWTPLLWIYAELFSGHGSIGYYFATWAAGLALVCAVFITLEAELGIRRAFALTVLFLSSPLRLEVFAWQMGFVYSLTALGVVLAWKEYRAGRPSWSLTWLTLAMLVYPQAAGPGLLFCWVYRRQWQGWAFAAVVGVVGVVQYALRVEHGFIPWAPTFASVPWVIPHYLLVALWPVGTLPILPSGFHWGLVPGVTIVSVWAAVHPRSLVTFIAVLAPTVAASVTESFYYAARYALVPSLCLLAWFALWWRTNGDAVRPRYVWAWSGALWVMTSMHSGFDGPRQMQARTEWECRLFYSEPAKFSRPWDQWAFANRIPLSPPKRIESGAGGEDLLPAK